MCYQRSFRIAKHFIPRTAGLKDVSFPAYQQMLPQSPHISGFASKVSQEGKMRKPRETQTPLERNEAAPDELGTDPREVGPESGGQSGDTQWLSTIEDADNESVDELAEEDQGIEAAAVEGVEDASDHPERPVHTHNEYGHPDDFPPAPESERKKAS
jgi:hypothetical protein